MFLCMLQYFVTECCQFGLSTCILYTLLLLSITLKHSHSSSFIDIITISIISLILVISLSFIILEVIKKFHRNEKYVGMAMVNKLHKQVRIILALYTEACVARYSNTSTIHFDSCQCWW